ncbi:MAG TPA: GIY-YIG nuclease family protein [Planctomycetaceae bacterium]|jgi:hypothetical protein|nr:GIY-YIG nuclease family protein [Planctomycetaceae bacterium]
MDRQEILREIRRTAEENGGKPLGQARFEQATGIRYSDWFGVYWRSWGQAVEEAGLPPNQMNAAYDEEVVIKAFLTLTREISAFPARGDLMLKSRRDPSFPSHNTFRRCLGSKAKCVAKLLAYCKEHEGFDDVVAILAAASTTRPPVEESTTKLASGFVYLIRHGSRMEYKIGSTNNQLRREGQIAIQLPERVAPVHVIETDDPVGVERYWHERFADKRKNGEWFGLNREDVRAFKRWRRIF